ncbi:MAG: hypothetical protein IKQ39_04290 [Oscillospiraceae bacterium]|nr:hypothetical protein [Oscillospiraceae bacterium]
MMKKILAMLSAAVLGCCALTAPAFAEETAAPETEQTYQPGDVDMDGEITAKDALRTLKGYVRTIAGHPDIFMTDEQIELSHVLGLETPGKVYVVDAQLILQYSVRKLAGWTQEQLDSFFPYQAEQLKNGPWWDKKQK